MAARVARPKRGSFMTWFREQSYQIVRMLLYQFGIAILGIILVSAASKWSNILLIVSIYAVGFYMALLYTMTWELGAKDRIRADAGIVRFDGATGAKIALCAALPNGLILLFLVIGYLFGSLVGEASWAQAMFGIAHAVAIVWESMYTGFIQNALPPATTSSLSVGYVVAYALTILPAIGASVFGYAMGSHGKRIFGGRSGKKEK